jgi:hypothetical protein
MIAVSAGLSFTGDTKQALSFTGSISLHNKTDLNIAYIIAKLGSVSLYNEIGVGMYIYIYTYIHTSFYMMPWFCSQSSGL